jgi:hypothetical protein
MSTPTASQLTTDKIVSIILMAVAALGTIIWAPLSLMLAMVSDAGMTPLLYVFLYVAWFGPAIATIVGIVIGVIGLRNKTGRAWVRVLISMASAPVAIIILALFSSASASK